MPCKCTMYTQRLISSGESIYRRDTIVLTLIANENEVSGVMYYQISDIISDIHIKVRQVLNGIDVSRNTISRLIFLIPNMCIKNDIFIM